MAGARGPRRHPEPTAGTMEFATVELSDSLQDQHHGEVDSCIRRTAVRTDGSTDEHDVRRPVPAGAGIESSNVATGPPIDRHRSGERHWSERSWTTPDRPTGRGRVCPVAILGVTDLRGAVHPERGGPAPAAHRPTESPPGGPGGRAYWSWDRPTTVLGWSTTTPVFPVTVRLPTTVLSDTLTPPEFPFTVTTASALA